MFQVFRKFLTDSFIDYSWMYHPQSWILNVKTKFYENDNLKVQNKEEEQTVSVQQQQQVQVQVQENQWTSGPVKVLTLFTLNNLTYEKIISLSTIFRDRRK